MKAFQILTLALIAVLLAAMSGCKGDDPIPAGSGLGGATITKYVAIGNSLSAGFQSNGLYASAQQYSFPNLIAGQLKVASAPLGSFEQPLWPDPGSFGSDLIHASRYELISLVGPVVGPRGLIAVQPPFASSALARPYDNLGVPGAVIFDFTDTTDFGAKSVARANPFFSVILRNPALGKSIFQQAVALNPGLVTFWLGNNDVLGFATSGGVSPATPTPSGAFTALYTDALTQLRAALPNTKILVATIPDVTAIPFFTTIGPSVRPNIPNGVKLRYQRHGVTGVALDSTLLNEATPPLLCLTGSTYAALLGRPTGKWYLDNHYPALPAGIDTTKAFGFDPRNPWPDALVLDAGEQATAAAAVASFNQTIFSVAASKNAAVVDINGFFNNVRANGYSWAGEKYTTDYITGGIFSLDGVHPSSRGAGIVANQFIKAMNEKFGTSVQYVNLGSLPGIPAGITKTNGAIPQLPPSAFGELEMLWRADR